ncbi:hypothetical protein BH11MYX4_BH11MYX4_19020 [soil metagenome]
MTHPNSLDLEAFACGEVSGPRAKVADHLVVCVECQAFVARLGGLVATNPSATEADALIARALAGALPVTSLAEVREARASAPRASETKPRAGKGRLWLLTTSVITPLAAAAAVVLLARSGGVKPPPAPEGSATAAPSAPDRIQMAPLPEPDTTFKGGRQIAVVRERHGEQARFASAVAVRPGDRLRVEVALDREQAILGAVLSDDGSYLELMPLAVRGPGTHFSEKSAKIDGTPTYGTIIIGSPEAVARARATHQLDGVSSLRVEWEGKP